MSRSIVQERELVEWAGAARPVAGEAVSGNLYLVKPSGHGVLLATIDGVGHGDEATAAARGAVSVREHHADESIISLVKRCHEAFTKTCGMVMTVASLNATGNTLAWLEAGNVNGLLWRADANASHPSERVLLLYASVLPVTPGDLLILATDGVRIGFADDVNLNEAPKQKAGRIPHRYSKGTDAALVLAARYPGAQHE